MKYVYMLVGTDENHIGAAADRFARTKKGGVVVSMEEAVAFQAETDQGNSVFLDGPKVFIVRVEADS